MTGGLKRIDTFRASPSGSTTKYSFDIEGRLTGTVLAAYKEQTTTQKGQPVSCQSTVMASVHRTYDFENHIRSQETTAPNTYALGCASNNYDSGLATIQWGAEGHPVIGTNLPSIGSGAYTLHWDGDVLLFVTNASGSLLSVNAGTDEFYMAGSSHVGVIDRDQSGNAIGISQSGTASPVSVDYSLSGQSSAKTPGYAAFSNLAFGYPKADGLDLGSNLAKPNGAPLPPANITVSGGRSYDSGFGSWTTPDAYKGSIDSPSSMERYMWNENNSVAYSDPSGFCSIAAPTTCAAQLAPVVAAATAGLEAAGAAVVSVVTAPLTIGVGAFAGLMVVTGSSGGIDTLKNTNNSGNAWVPPVNGEPGSTSVRGKTSRLYGPGGLPLIDVNLPHVGEGGNVEDEPHAHDYGPDRGPKTPGERGPQRPLKPGDPPIPPGVPVSY